MLLATANLPLAPYWVPPTITVNMRASHHCHLVSMLGGGQAAHYHLVSGSYHQVSGSYHQQAGSYHQLAGSYHQLSRSYHQLAGSYHQ